jgi:RND family efflux transporter MFP subunit
MKRKREYLILSGVVLAVFLLVFFRFSAKDAHADQPQDTSLPPVAVVRVTRGPMSNSLTLSGAFRPYQQVDVHAKVAGYIRHIYVDVGDKVKTGQALAVLEVPELTAQILGSEANIKRSQDAIRRAQSEIERAESSHQASHFGYTRLNQASASRPGLIAEQELDDAMDKDKESEAQVDSAKAAFSEAQNELAVSQASRKQLEAMQAYTQITAPFSGVITKRYADTGALIQAGTSSSTQAMPVVQLAEWSRLRLVVPVPESAVPAIRLGAAVQVRVAALNRNFEGHVARFADALDQQTRTMDTEIDVENRDGTLVDGMYAETTLVLSQVKGVLTVPIQAVQRGEGSSASVLIVDPQDRIEEREIKLGQEGDNVVEVNSGLLEGDRVVVGSRSEFRTGEKVHPKIMHNMNRKTEAGI